MPKLRGLMSSIMAPKPSCAFRLVRSQLYQPSESAKDCATSSLASFHGVLNCLVHRIRPHFLNNISARRCQQTRNAEIELCQRSQDPLWFGSVQKGCPLFDRPAFIKHRVNPIISVRFGLIQSLNKRLASSCVQADSEKKTTFS